MKIIYGKNEDCFNCNTKPQLLVLIQVKEDEQYAFCQHCSIHAERLVQKYMKATNFMKGYYA